MPGGCLAPVPCLDFPDLLWSPWRVPKAQDAWACPKGWLCQLCRVFGGVVPAESQTTCYMVKAQGAGRRESGQAETPLKWCWLLSAPHSCIQAPFSLFWARRIPPVQKPHIGLMVTKWGLWNSRSEDLPEQRTEGNGMGGVGQGGLEQLPWVCPVCLDRRHCCWPSCP